MSESYDVVVCGAGMAGLCSALSALESAASVMLIEKGPSAGGSFALAGGFVWTYAKLEEALAALPHADPGLVRLIVTSLRDDLEWLQSFGIKTWKAAPRGHAWGKALDPLETINRLVHLLADGGVELATSTGLSRIVPSEDADGYRVLVHDGEATRTVSAKSVVLATGGFQGNMAMVRQYLGISLDEVRLRANPWSTGAGLQNALACGGTTTRGLEHFYGHALADGKMGAGGISDLISMSQNYGHQGVALNLAGRRFVDESSGTGEELVNAALARQPGARGWYVVDANIARTSKLPHGSPGNTGIQRAEACGAPVVRANTVDELADSLNHFGVPAVVVKRTLAEYNAHVAAAHVDAIWPPRIRNRTPLVEAPFTAVRVRAGITFTMGGIAVNERMEVLDAATVGSDLHTADWTTESDLAPARDRAFGVAGLYAAGADVGNISNTGYLGGLGTALVTGRIAGRQAALRACSRNSADPESRTTIDGLNASADAHS